MKLDFKMLKLVFWTQKLASPAFFLQGFPWVMYVIRKSFGLEKFLFSDHHEFSENRWKNPDLIWLSNALSSGLRTAASFGPNSEIEVFSSRVFAKTNHRIMLNSYLYALTWGCSRSQVCTAPSLQAAATWRTWINHTNDSWHFASICILSGTRNIFKPLDEKPHHELLLSTLGVCEPKWGLLFRQTSCCTCWSQTRCQAVRLAGEVWGALWFRRFRRSVSQFQVWSCTACFVFSANGICSAELLYLVNHTTSMSSAAVESCDLTD